MPRVNKFQHYNLDFDDQQKLSVATFLGVDYNPAQLQVADNHAVDILNIVYKDKVNQKRSGWEQVLQIKPQNYYIQNSDGSFTEQVNSVHINGIWRFKAENEGTYTITHIGNLLYLVSNMNKEGTFLTMSVSPILSKVVSGGLIYNVCGYELEDYKSMAFYGSHRLYLLGGSKYLSIRVYDGAIHIEEVEDNKETYIPVTTIGITYADSSINEQQALDDVNLLTQYRKNKLVSGTYVDDGVSVRTTRFWDYSLDTNIQPKSPTDINNIVIKISELKEVE